MRHTEKKLQSTFSNFDAAPLTCFQKMWGYLVSDEVTNCEKLSKIIFGTIFNFMSGINRKIWREGKCYPSCLRFNKKQDSLN